MGRLGNMSKFDELQSKLIALDQEEKRDREAHDCLERKRKHAQERLETLRNRRTNLDNEESNLQDNLSVSQSELDK